MFALFTDFGVEGPYLGQMKAVLHQGAPGWPVVDLMVDAPSQDPHTSAYLLAAFSSIFTAGTIFVCIVDPGVGTDRAPIALRADGRWFLGPDNGLLELVARRASDFAWHRIAWQPARLSSSFHGRDLFAPAAAALARGDSLALEPLPWGLAAARSWPDELARVIYCDAYGNAMTGLSAADHGKDEVLEVGQLRISWAPTFASVPRGTPFWYENSSGLVEIAVNCGRAADLPELSVGSAVQWCRSP